MGCSLVIHHLWISPESVVEVEQEDGDSATDYHALKDDQGMSPYAISDQSDDDMVLVV